MKHINRIAKLSDIDYSPLAQNVDTDFVHAWADYLHGFPIAWLESVLNRTELEACGTASFIGEVPKIIEALSHEVQRFHSHQNII
jgi:ferredoxin-NADP reductase